VAEIRVGSEPIETVFDLLGKTVIDLTYPLGWGPPQSGDPSSPVRFAAGRLVPETQVV
jgi:hypothetical protein